MQIIATSQPTPFSRRTVLAPDAAAPMPVDHAKELLKAVRSVARKNVAPIGIAGVTWKLTTVPNTMSSQDLATLLTNNNISPDKAPAFANEIRDLLSNPALRTLLVGVSGGAAAYVIVEKTSWSRRTKWLTTIGVGALCAGLYLLLRYYGIMK